MNINKWLDLKMPHLPKKQPPAKSHNMHEQRFAFPKARGLFDRFRTTEKLQLELDSINRVLQEPLTLGKHARHKDKYGLSKTGDREYYKKMRVYAKRANRIEQVLTFRENKTGELARKTA